LNDAFKRFRVVFVGESVLINLEHIRLKLQSPWDFVGHDNVAHSEHLLVNLGVMFEELLGGNEITDALVHVEAVEEL